MSRQSYTIAVFALLAISPVTGLGAQQARDVPGRVFSVQDSTPISGVTVRIPALGIGTSTDGSGNFVLLGIPREPYSVTFQRIGMAPDTVRES